LAKDIPSRGKLNKYLLYLNQHLKLRLKLNLNFRSPLTKSGGGSSHVSPSQHYQLQQTGSSPLQQQQQQQQQHLTVPNQGLAFIRPNLSPPQQQMLLAPPSASQLAQRRFSEVDAAIERHNSRRQAKRSQSVMYRQNANLPHGGRNRNRNKRSGSDVNTNDVEAVQVQQRRRESRALIVAPTLQQQLL
jgi:hypothetical protein